MSYLTDSVTQYIVLVLSDFNSMLGYQIFHIAPAMQREALDFTDQIIFELGQVGP